MFKVMKSNSRAMVGAIFGKGIGKFNLLAQERRATTFLP